MLPDPAAPVGLAPVRVPRAHGLAITHMLQARACLVRVVRAEHALDLVRVDAVVRANVRLVRAPRRALLVPAVQVRPLVPAVVELREETILTPA